MKGILLLFLCSALAWTWGGEIVSGMLSVRGEARSPASIACVHESMVMDGLGVLFPGEEQAHVPGGIVTFGGGEDTWPQLFRMGLVPVETDGTLSYPFTVELDDETGDALFRNANGALFYSIEPAYAAATDWFRMRLGVPAFGPVPAYRELSHLVSEWILVHEDDVEVFVESRNVQSRNVQSRKVQGRRIQSREVEGLAFTEFEITDSEPPEYVFSVAWNGDVIAANDVLDLYGAPALTTNEWYRIASIAATNESPFELTLSETNFPWYVPPVECPRDGCTCPACIPVVVTNFAGSAFDPSATNLTMTIVTNTTCDCPLGAPTGFFRLFRRADSDADGLLDAEEVLLYGTIPRAPDSDVDGLDDGKEIELGTNPRSVDTDEDWLTDKEETPHWSHSPEMPWFDLGTNATILATNDADGEFFSISLPAPIVFAGSPCTNLLCSRRGFVYAVNPYAPAPARHISRMNLASQTVDPNHSIVAGYWANLRLRPELGSVIRTATVSWYNKTYQVIEYDHVGFLPYTQSTDYVSFQIAFQLTGFPGFAYVRYGTLSDSTVGTMASIGSQGPNRRFNLPVAHGVAHSVHDGETIVFHVGTGTDPCLFDTDGDGFSDFEEVEIGLDPTRDDTDYDGLPDDWELDVGLDPCDQSDDNGRDGDPDADGITNWRERYNGLAPLLADTDGDGIPDGTTGYAWSNHVLRATASRPANLILTAVASYPRNRIMASPRNSDAPVPPEVSSAAIRIGSLTLPLTEGTNEFELSLTTGTLYDIRLGCTGGARATFGLASPEESDQPLWTDLPDDGGSVWRTSCAGRVAIPVLRLRDLRGDTVLNRCLHGTEEGVELVPSILPAACESLLTHAVPTGLAPRENGHYWLSVGPNPGDESTGTLRIVDLAAGILEDFASAHRCAGATAVCCGCDAPRTEIIVSVPTAVFLNDDDDNDNGIEDRFETGPIQYSDDDLVPITITFRSAEPQAGQIVLSAPNQSQCCFWTTDRKQECFDSLTFPLSGALTEASWMIFVEGTNLSFGVDDVTILVRHQDSLGVETFLERKQMTVISVPTIEIPNGSDDGLVILAGSILEFRILCEPSSLEIDSAIVCNWKYSRRKTQIEHLPWKALGEPIQGCSAAFQMNEPGCHRVIADVFLSGARRTVPFRRIPRPEYDCDEIESWDYVGVASTEEQITLRNAAYSQLGSPVFAKRKKSPQVNGFAVYPSSSWKCNLFVADCILQAGLSVPTTYVSRVRKRSYPPFSNDWAVGVPIPGWRFVGVGVSPEPGFVVGHPNFDGSGHVGIVDYDGYAIGAGERIVSRKFSDFLDGTSGYNCWKGEDP